MTGHFGSWEDLAEKTFFSVLSEREIREMGLTFKPGKEFSDLARAVDSIIPRPPFSYESVVADREDALREYLEGNLTNEREL